MEEVVASSSGSSKHRRSVCGLVSFAAGAVTQAITVATVCAEFTGEGWSLETAVTVGQLAGAVVWSAAADAVGRKEALCLACVVSAAGCASAAFAATFATLRLACFAAGLGCVGGPTLFIVETSSAATRGRDTVLTVGLAGSLGAAAAVAMARLRASPFAPWRLLCLLVAAWPLVAGVVASAKLDESLRWLVWKRRFAAARGLLERRRSLLDDKSAQSGGDDKSDDAALLAFDRLVAGRPQTPPHREEVKEETATKSPEVVTTTTTSAETSSKAEEEESTPPPQTKKKKATSRWGLVSACAVGLCWLASFGLACVVALARFEFDENDDERDEQRCPAVELVRSALVAEVAALLVAAHLVDHLGRRPTLALACAAAAAGAIVVAAPAYFPDLLVHTADTRRPLAAVVASRGALRAASVVATLLVAEIHATPRRATAAALAAVLASLAALLAADYVVAPNPVATVALLLTLIDVSAAWAALALPLEPAHLPVDDFRLRPEGDHLGIVDLFDHLGGASPDDGTSAGGGQLLAPTSGATTKNNLFVLEAKADDFDDPPHSARLWQSRRDPERTPLLNHCRRSPS